MAPGLIVYRKHASVSSPRLDVFGAVSKQDTEPVVAVKIEELKLVCMFVCLFVFDVTAPSGPGPPHSQGF